MSAAMVATFHRNIAARFSVASASATDAMFAGTDTRHRSRSKERWRRLFLPSTAHLADIRSAALSWLPIERGKVAFGHACNVAMLGGARKRQLLLVLSALFAYVIDCCF
jgi:hypothetical protein